MIHLQLKSLLPAAAVALVLAGCGGGGGDFQNEPRGSNRSASVTVANSVDATLNGGYASANVFLNDIEKVAPIGGIETCRQRFSTLPKTGNAQMIMDGEIRYKPGTTEMFTTVVSINTIEFNTIGPAGALVDRTNNIVTFNNAIMTSTQGTGRTMVLSGTVPLRAENKPEGC